MPAQAQEPHTETTQNNTPPPPLHRTKCGGKVRDRHRVTYTLLLVDVEYMHSNPPPPQVAYPLHFFTILSQSGLPVPGGIRR